MYNIGAPDWVRSLIWVREVAGPGSVDAPAVVFRGRRLWLREKLVLASTADHYGIFTTDEDEASAATVTYDSGILNRENIFDHDDDTYGEEILTLDGYEEKKVLIIDLGSVADRWMFFKHEGVYDWANSKIYVSEDGSTWVEAGSVTGGVDIKGYYDTFRYVRWTARNTHSTSENVKVRLYSLEVYPSINRSSYLFYTVTDELLTVLTDAGGYWLYEVIYEFELPEVG